MRKGLVNDVIASLFITTVCLFLAGGWALFLPGCSDSSPDTWGDGAEQISEAFCNARIECRIDAEEDRQACVEYNVTGLCDIWDCSVELEPEHAEMFAQCAEDLDNWRCGPFLPGSCYAVLELR